MKKISRKLLIFTLAIFVLLIVFLPPFKRTLVFTTQYFVSGSAKIISGVSYKIKNTFSFWGNIHNLRDQNERLAVEIAQLQIDRSRIVELENENALLKREMGFAEGYGEVDLIPARIIERDQFSFLDYVVVDKGDADGVEVGQAVMSSGAMIGRIKELYRNSAKVNLITSRDSTIQAMLQDSRSKGVLNGGVTGLLLDNIIQDAEFVRGEYVVTSGLGGSIRPGIPIGRAKSEQLKGGIFKSIVVEPIADLSKIELVFITDEK